MVHRQPSLFGVSASDPSPQDLAGLLAGPGRVSRMGGTARVSVAVGHAWRVHVLVAELAERALPATWQSTEPATGPSGFMVHTAYTVRLLPLARAWSSPGAGEASLAVPLTGHALRLWVAAGGSATPDGYVLELDPHDEPCWPALGAALQAIGLPSALLAPGPARTPGYRITGRRRLARLAELVGEPPPAAAADHWPAAG